MRRWEVGSSVVLREVWLGRVWAAQPAVVVEDHPKQRMFYIPPGTVLKLAASDDDGSVLRLPREQWGYADHVIHRHVLSFAWPSGDHAVLATWEEHSHVFRGWYVNLESPLRPGPMGFDYLDHMLDVVVAPDRRSWRWKDEDELEEAVARGLFAADEAERFRAAGLRAVERLQRHDPPFDRAWEDWRPDPSWPVPVVPPGWDAV